MPDQSPADPQRTPQGQSENTAPSVGPSENQPPLDQALTSAASQSSNENNIGQSKANLIGMAFALSLVLSILQRVFYGSWMTFYSLLASTLILSSPFLISRLRDPNAPTESLVVMPEWRLGVPIGAAIGFLYGCLFGGMVSNAFYGAFIGAAVMGLTKPFLNHAPSLKPAAGWIGGAFVVLHLTGFLTPSRGPTANQRLSDSVANNGTSDGINTKRSSGVVAPGKGKKLTAFKDVVAGWEHYLDAIGDDATKKRWLQNMRQVQERFIEIPFEPKADLDSLKESKEILELFTQRLRGTSEIMTTYHETGNEFEAADELALWTQLTTHLNEVFGGKT